MKQKLSDVVLIALALGLGGYLLVTQREPTQAEIEARQDNLLPAFDPESVEAIKIADEAGKVVVTLRRDRSDPETRVYFLGAEGERLAEQAATDEFLASLDFGTWQRRLNEKELDPATFGFGSPKAKISVEAGPRSYVVVLGGAAPYPKDAVYAAVTDQGGTMTYGVVTKETAAGLVARAEQFETQLVFPLSRRQTTELLVERGTETTRLLADELGFRLAEKEGSPSLRADRALTDAVFFQLARAKFETYLTSDEAARLIGKEGNFVVLTQKGPEGTYKAVWGGACPGAPDLAVVQRLLPQPTSGCSSKAPLAALRLGSERYVARTSAPLRADETDHVTIEWNSRKLDVMRSDADYVLVSSEGRKIAKDAGDDFLKTLTETQLELLPTSTPWENPSGGILLRGQSPLTASARVGSAGSDAAHLEGVREIKIEVRLDEASKRVQIRRLDDGAILAVPPDAEWAFLGDSAWTKERALAKFSEGDVQRVTIKSAHGDRAEIARRGEEFDLIQPRGGTADVPLTKHLVDELSHLSAVRFLPSKERPKGGLFEVSWQLAGQTTPSRLWIGKRIRGGFEAWSTLSEGPFVLSTAARDVFETPLVDRSPVRLDPDEFSRITLRAGDRLYSFAREGEVLRATGGQALDDMVTELEEALRALDVVAAAPSGAAELPRRSSPEIVFEGLRGTGDEAESVVLEIGGLGVWQGQGVRGVWRDGKLYLLRAASVTPLIELL